MNKYGILLMGISALLMSHCTSKPSPRAFVSKREHMEIKGNVRLLEEQTYSYNVEGDTIRNVHTYLFDNEGKLLEYTFMNKNNDSVLKTYEYMGKLLIKKKTTYFGLYEAVDSFAYDKAHLPTEVKCFDHKKSLKSLQKRAYNEAGLLISTRTFDKNGIFGEGKDIQYNDDGYITEKILRNKDNNITMHEKYVYNDKNELIETYLIDPRGKVFMKLLRTYNDKSNPITEKFYTSEDKLLVEERENYIYDEQGNWTSRISTNTKGEVILTTLRTFSYY